MVRMFSFMLKRLSINNLLQIRIQERVQLFGGPLDFSYSLMQFHFHWGPNDTVGSEHSFARTHFPLEVLLSIESCAFRVPERNQSGTVAGALFGSFHRYVCERTTLPSPIKLDDLLPKNRNSYFYYSGSLTTPPCSEVVEWIVLNHPSNVTEEQVYPI
ncbi:unnamed protein product [Soboliphyme baturini]|uniref:carbonic anhydrase n=1 Tax=Soboliphyme baturini TaxID=241478 RepID=A0A183ILP6_9BILA|nr:unnamed protein product [Soboliphyme baturini]